MGLPQPLRPLGSLRIGTNGACHRHRRFQWCLLHSRAPIVGGRRLPHHPSAGPRHVAAQSARASARPPGPDRRGRRYPLPASPPISDSISARRPRRIRRSTAPPPFVHYPSGCETTDVGSSTPRRRWDLHAIGSHRFGSGRSLLRLLRGRPRGPRDRHPDSGGAVNRRLPGHFPNPRPMVGQEASQKPSGCFERAFLRRARGLQAWHPHRGLGYHGFFFRPPDPCS